MGTSFPNAGVGGKEPAGDAKSSGVGGGGGKIVAETAVGKAGSEDPQPISQNRTKRYNLLDNNNPETVRRLQKIEKNLRNLYNLRINILIIQKSSYVQN